MGYGGSTSDRQVIERSSLLEKCKKGDSIIADRGLNVQDLFAAKGVSLNIPTFLKGRSYVTKSLKCIFIFDIFIFYF